MQSSLRVAFKYKTTARTAQGRKGEATDGAWEGHNGHAGAAPEVCTTPCLVLCLGKRATPRPAHSSASAVCAPELEWPLCLLAFIKPFPIGLSSAWSLSECREPLAFTASFLTVWKEHLPWSVSKLSPALRIWYPCSGRDSTGLITLLTFPVTFAYIEG